MVRLYLNENGKKGQVRYIDVNIWSLVKASILADLIIYGVVFGVAFILGLFVGLVGI